MCYKFMPAVCLFDLRCLFGVIIAVCENVKAING